MFWKNNQGSFLRYFLPAKPTEEAEFWKRNLNKNEGRIILRLWYDNTKEHLVSRRYSNNYKMFEDLLTDFIMHTYTINYNMGRWGVHCEQESLHFEAYIYYLVKSEMNFYKSLMIINSLSILVHCPCMDFFSNSDLAKEPKTAKNFTFIIKLN